MTFSKEILARAVVATNGELAWNEHDIINVINELVNNKEAIAGGEVWLVSQKLIEHPPLTQLVDGRSVFGIIPGIDGNEYVLQWNCNRKDGESWDDYVYKSKEKALNAIQEMHLTSILKLSYLKNIFYNFTFTQEKEVSK